MLYNVSRLNKWLTECATHSSKLCVISVREIQDVFLECTILIIVLSTHMLKYSKSQANSKSTVISQNLENCYFIFSRF
jgi:hypothetical protein